MSEILELAERCEKATGPDRETDLAIYLTLWPASDLAKITERPRGLEGQEGYSWDIRGTSVVYEKWTDDGRCPVNGGYPLPAYTASIDAAMTLVPEGHSAGLNTKPCAASIFNDSGNIVHEHGHILAASAALALCAAALRARASVEGSPK